MTESVTPPTGVSLALAAHDERLLAAALRSEKVAIPVIQGQTAARILRGADDRRYLMAFSTPETARAFGELGDVGLVIGRQLPGIARASGVGLIRFDPAGPVPVEMSTRYLQSLLDGVMPTEDGGQELVEPLTVHAADSALDDPLRDRIRGAGLPLDDVLFVEREADGRRVLTLVVPEDRDGGAYAEAVGPVVPAGQPLDVVVLTEEGRAAVIASVPSAPLQGQG